MNKKKNAILVVSFGTTYIDTLKKNIEQIENDIKNKFSDFEVRRAFTSNIVIKRLKEKFNIYVDDVETALYKLKFEKYKNIICQPTHIISGFEYEKLKKIVNSFQNSFDKIIVGEPLLFDNFDNNNVVDCLKSEFSNEEEKAIVFIGHGTEHESDITYSKINNIMEEEKFFNAFIGTIEGDLDINIVLNKLEEKKYKEAILTPFMLVAGDHAVNDICNNKDSWKNLFEKNGIKTKCILKGLAEYKSIRDIYINKLDNIIKNV